MVFADAGKLCMIRGGGMLVVRSAIIRQAKMFCIDVGLRMVRGGNRICRSFVRCHLPLSEAPC